MASLATNVALHCVICFEEFSLRERPPVVLPCGHTYVCSVCSKRLKKCMECREPLFWAPPVSKVGKSQQQGTPATLNTQRTSLPLRYTGGSTAARGRYSPSPQNLPHPTMPQDLKEEPLALPLPKNLVLLDMIEAAHRERFLRAQNEGKLFGESLADEEGDGNIGTTQEEVLRASSSSEELARLEASATAVAAMTGTCGSYAVREPEGLAILPFDPNKQHKKEEEIIGDNCHKEPYIVGPGHILQVVRIDEGVYKLARGKGFVVATVNQLVKGTYVQCPTNLLLQAFFCDVLFTWADFDTHITFYAVGGPLESSCRLEGMLTSVSEKEKELERALQETKELAAGLRRLIQRTQESPEQHPVVNDPRATEDIMKEVSVQNRISEGRTRANAPSPIDTTASYSPTTNGVLRASQSDGAEYYGASSRPSDTTPMTLDSPARSCPMPTFEEDNHNTVPQSGLPPYRVNNDEDFTGLSLGFGCGSSLFGDRLLAPSAPSSNLMSVSFDESLVDQGNSSSAARANRLLSMSLPAPRTEIYQLPESPIRSGGSFDGVNFRTGMSGHRGLNQARKKSSPSAQRREVRMMSVHSGLGAVNRKSNNGNPRGSASPTIYAPRVLSPPTPPGNR